MELGHGIFAVKLVELEQEYGHLQSRIRLFQRKDLEQLHRELERLQDEYQEQNLLLEEMVRSCRSPVMARLAKLQHDYEQQAEDYLKTNLIPAQADDANATCQDRADTTTLYAEFAIDFATQAMRYALISAFSAMELQMQADRDATKGAHNAHE